MAKIAQIPEIISPEAALRLINHLERQANSATSEQLRRVLLQAGCQIADATLETQRIIRPSRKAA